MLIYAHLYCTAIYWRSNVFLVIIYIYYMNGKWKTIKRLKKYTLQGPAWDAVGCDELFYGTLSNNFTI